MDAPALRLRFRTARLPLPTNLLSIAAGHEPMVWLRRGGGTVGLGQAAAFETSGPQRFEQAARWFDQLVTNATIEGPSQMPGMAPLALGAFSFSDSSPTPSRLVVPAVAVSRRRGAEWVTTAGVEEAAEPAAALAELVEAARTVKPGQPGRPAMTEAAGHHPADAWPGVIGEALDAIGHRVVDKVVLARDVAAVASQPVNLLAVIRQLTTAYRDCWTYCLDGLVGATPELLIRAARGLVTSRVLAGTIRRTGNDVADLARAGALARSSKDLEEHQLAVESVVQTLRPFTEELSVPDAPSVLHLPNVMHLATDVVGDLKGRNGNAPSSLELAAALHPTAAVCGTPREAAYELLEHLEGTDRGRYSGPVGWLAADGAGEWGIALRCAQFDTARQRARLWAGGGIVAASVPADELAETEAKLAPMRQALGLA
ncbi:MAG: isochorismate synthase [Bifidobacteriaceae bacterium]|jgi:menaquinone-specific isochorismate synthase|nr:isochorismate synthase [Bifidobacteriaceae bacterium]